MHLAYAFFLATTPAALGQDAPPAEIVPRDWLAVRSIDRIRSRRPFRTDAVFLRHLLDPAAAPPVEGDTVTGENGEGVWERVEADEGRPCPERRGGWRGWGRG